MVYMGTTAAAGKADAVVVATGMDTELGRIAGMLGGTEREPTPLQRRLAELGKVLIAVVLGIVALIFLLRLLRGAALLELFLLSVSLAVAAVPEGLPAVVTLALAIGPATDGPAERPDPQAARASRRSARSPSSAPTRPAR